LGLDGSPLFLKHVILLPGEGPKMNTPMEYQVALLKDGSDTIYASTGLIAADNAEAIKKAKEWTASFNFVAEDAWLQINLNGIGIRSLRPGSFEKARSALPT
jgi:hypothetical protein